MPQWSTYIVLLLCMAVGAFFLTTPHRVVRFLAKITNSYFRGMGATDQQIDARLELPWERYTRQGLTQSAFWREAEHHPESLKRLLVYVRVLGAAFAFMSGAALLLAVVLQLAGVGK